MGLDPKSATAATASLAPGFRFHPTDEELVRYYLKRKVCQKPFRFDAISEIDIYKSEPWDLPGKSKLKSRDLEWYFFSILDKKYGNGSKTNRATEKGYWKTTGKDRPVVHRSRTVGMKKTLVYHSGRAPKGARSNWVMHEYRLVDEELGNAGIYQDAFVLCRVFQKSGTGPKNGEQYGAPFVEEEWEDDDLVMVPGEVAAEEVAVGEDAYLDGDDLEQILDTEIQSEDVPLPVSFYYGDNGINTEQPEDLFDDPPKPLADMGGSCIAPEELEGQKLFHLQNDTDMKIVKHEYIGEPSNSEDLADVDYLLDEPFLDAMGNPPFDSGQFLETNDLSNPIEEDRSGFDMVEDYLTFFDADENNRDCVGFDASKIMESENLWSDQLSLTEQDVVGGAPHESVESEHVLQGQSKDVASTSKQEPSYLKSDIQHPFLKQASCMLGNIPAPPAFASEFPSKGAALCLNSGSHSSSSIHVTAGMIRIRNTTLTADATYWSPGKNVDINIILSFGPSQDDDGGGGGMLFGKSASTMSWSWFYLVIFLWVMILPLSFKIGTCFYTGKAS